MQPGLEVIWLGGGVTATVHLSTSVIRFLLGAVTLYYIYSKFDFALLVPISIADLWFSVPLAALGDIDAYRFLFVAAAIAIGAALFSIFHI